MKNRLVWGNSGRYWCVPDVCMSPKLCDGNASYTVVSPLCYSVVSPAFHASAILSMVLPHFLSHPLSPSLRASLNPD